MIIFEQQIRMISEGTCDTGVMILKIQLCRHINKLLFKIKQIKSQKENKE